MTVAAILAAKGRDVVTADPDSPIIEVCRLLTNRGIGAVLILEAGAIAGIFSERDLVRAVAREGAAILEHPVRKFMTTAVAICHPSDTTGSLMEQMTQGKFRHLPVVENGALVGIVSIGDVVKQRIAEAEAESAAMREYITSG